MKQSRNYLTTKFLTLLLFLSIVPLAFSVSGTSQIDKDLDRVKAMLPKSCRVKVTSGKRSKSKNKKVGGVSNSYHLHDRARDIVTNCKSLFISMAQEVGLTTIEYDVHVHVDNREKQLCLIKKKKQYLPCYKNGDKDSKKASNKSSNKDKNKK